MRSRRWWAGVVIAAIAHIFLAIMLVFVVPTSRTLSGLDPNADPYDSERVICGQAADLTDDAAIFASAFLLLPGYLLAGLVEAVTNLSLSTMRVAIVLVSTALFGAYGGFLATSERRGLALGLAVFYIGAASVAAIVFRALFGLGCAIP